MTPELVDRLVEERRFKNLEIGREELESLAGSGMQVPFESFVTGIFDHYGAVHGKRLVGDKTPRYVRSIPTLHDLWPETKFVHLIRDGRDVCLSMMNWKKADSSAGQFSAWKEDRVSTGRSGGAERTSGPPGRWIRWPPSSTTRSTTKSWSPNLKRRARISATWDCPTRRHASFPRGARDSGPRPRREKGVAASHPGPSQVERADVYRDLRRFEAATGDLGTRYPRAVPDPPQEALAWTARIRETFTWDVPSSGDRLPVGWTT